jgi:hypothetical protein
MVSQVEDHIGINGTEVQRAILLGAETGAQYRRRARLR